MLSRVSKPGVVAVTSRFAASWNTRAQWSCLGFICGLARTASAGEVIVNGHWFRRVSGATTGVVGATDPISTFVAKPPGAMLVWRVCGHEQLQRVESADAAQRWGAVEHPKAGNREELASGRLACAQCAQMGEDRERPHNRRTPQVTDHGLPSEHK